MSSESSGVAVDESTGRVDPLAGLAVGRIVHYVCGGPQDIEAAIVTSVNDRASGMCNLRTFPDQPDVQNFGDTFHLAVRYDEGHSARTWHWPPRA